VQALRPLLILGLDGATLDVIRPLAAAGRLPNLEAWMKAGDARPLASTVPPMSFPAWSSFATGLGPGEHGLLDFTQKLPGAYRLRFVNASDRSGRSLFARVSDAGGTVLALGMPATWPPEPVNGLLVPGFDAPVSVGSDAAASSDPALYREIAASAGPWMTPDLAEGADADSWHETAAALLPTRIERKTRFALEAIRKLRAASGGRGPDLACIVFAESDTAAHHFWRDYDAASPRHDPRASAARRDAIPAVYQALDTACGMLRDAFGEDSLCVVMSDHGAGGASQRIVHLNRRLEECGLLRRAAPTRAPARDILARGARDVALRVLPPRLAQSLFRRARGTAARLESAARFGGFDWARTPAFSEEANTQPGIWLNLSGREASGCVARTDRERVLRELMDAVLDWKLPGGGAVVARARPREEVYAGPFVERAPDLVLELGLDAGYGLSLVPTPWRAESRESVRTLAEHALAGGRGRGMNGVHRPDGMLLAIGPATDELSGVTHLQQLAPACLRTMGIPWADEAASPPAPTPYTPEEEAEVAARLRGLGYLD
jgi:predicted AlkP superfamily phosphohydrolase/phosphomutase